VGIDENFFLIGGHSLLAVRLFSRIAGLLGRSLPLSAIYYAPTIGQLSDLLDRQNWMPPWKWLAPVQPEGSLRPLFLVPPAARTSLSFLKLASCLGPDQPLYSFDPSGSPDRPHPHERLEAMAADYLSEVRLLQPEGPYRLGGKCAGAEVALEMARQVVADGQDVELLVMLDPATPASGPSWRRREDGLAAMIRHNFRELVSELKRDPTKISLPGKLWQLSVKFAHWLRTREPRYRQWLVIHRQALRSYTARRYPGRIILIQSDPRPARLMVRKRWAELADGGLEVFVNKGLSHSRLLTGERGTRQMGEQLRLCIERLNGARAESAQS
jgi:thioesterase domain-containing protein